MGRPKGTKNKTHRIWSKEKKMRAINLVVSGQQSQTSVARSLKISSGMMTNWMKTYQEEGEETLARRPGNHHPGLKAMKEKASAEKLKEIEILELRIENERLKKGYMVKGRGKNKEFVTSKDVNSKSLKDSKK